MLEEVERLPKRCYPGSHRAVLPGRPVARAGRPAAGCPIRTVQTRLHCAGRRSYAIAWSGGGWRAPPDFWRRRPRIGGRRGTVVLDGSVSAALSRTTARMRRCSSLPPALPGSPRRPLAGPQSAIQALFWKQLWRAAGALFGLAAGLSLTFWPLLPASQEPDRPGADDLRAYRRRPGPAHPRRRGLDAGFVRKIMPTRLPTRQPIGMGTTF